jgi:TRAP transporter 4TM/12TM fusion protein
MTEPTEATGAADAAPTIPENPESRSKRLHGGAYAAVAALTIAGLSLSINQIFNLGAFGFRPVSTAYYYLMIGIFGAVGYLTFSARKADAHRARWYDWLLGGALLGISVWLAVNAQAIIDQGWNMAAPGYAAVIAGVYIVLILENLRRTGEAILLVFCLIFAAYPLYAGHMPGFLWGVQLTPAQTASEFVYGLESIIGIPVQVISDTLIGFLVFGVILAGAGGGAFFMEFASALMGRSRGGPAKVAIISSGLFGMLSGSATSNVLTTGTMTIPAMKRCGYSATYAGAVEACASTGGALMPPIMGAAAFIMASFLNVPYSEVIVAAFLPAMLYYLALMLQTDLYAARNGLRGLAAEEIPRLGPVLRRGWFYLFAIAVLTWLLIAYRIADEAPFYVSVFLLLVAAMQAGRESLKARWILNLIVDAGQSIAQILGLVAGIGLIVGAMSVTGVANSFSRELVQYAGGNVPLLLATGALTSFILGMGMTASACYIFLAIVLAPALVKSGLDPMASHLYIFYWGIVSFITPPVALAAIAAASIAKSNPMATGFTALRVGALLLVLPVLFVLQPALILKGAPLEVVQASITAVAAVVLLAGATEGHMYGVGRLGVWARLGLAVGGMLMLVPEATTDYIGLGIGVATAFAARALGRTRFEKRG